MLLSLKRTFIHRMGIRSEAGRAPGIYICSFLITLWGKHRVLLDTLTVSEGHGKNYCKVSLSNIIAELPRGVSWDLWRESERKKSSGNNKQSSWGHSVLEISHFHLGQFQKVPVAGLWRVGSLKLSCRAQAISWAEDLIPVSVCCIDPAGEQPSWGLREQWKGL